jgi:hypothetical protein
MELNMIFSHYFSGFFKAKTYSYLGQDLVIKFFIFRKFIYYCRRSSRVGRRYSFILGIDDYATDVTATMNDVRGLIGDDPIYRKRFQKKHIIDFFRRESFIELERMDQKILGITMNFGIK